MAKRGTWIRGIREKGDGILVLDAGDLLFKKFSKPVPENESKMVMEKAHLIIKSLNLMDYDVLGVGDDDLTLGKEFLLEISKKANFPFLCSNIFDEASEKLLFQPYLIKQINGLRIGIFSLLSPDLFLDPSDPRKKGIAIHSPVEVAQNMVKELQPKTDLIILLSHLSYPRDMELAQNLTGIHIIAGSHTGLNLVNPPVIKNTIILQTPRQGMYAAKFDLTFSNHESGFYNLATKRSIERNLNNLRNRLNSPEPSKAEKAQLQRLKEEAERSLKQFHEKNEFTNKIFPLDENIEDHPDILRMIDEYKFKFPEVSKPITSK